MEENNNKSLESLNNEVKEFHSELFLSTPEKKSIKEQIQEIHQQVTDSHSEMTNKVERVNKFFNELFENTEVRPSIEEKISIFYSELFEGSEEKNSIKNEIESFLSNAKSDYTEFLKHKSEVSNFHKLTLEGDENNFSTKEEINRFYDKLFTDKEGVESLKTKFDKLIESLDNRFTTTDSQFKELTSFHDKVFNDQKDEDGTIVKPSLIKSIEQQKLKLEGLIQKANEKLYALTDSSLHNAFAKRAEEYTKEFTRLEGLTHKLTWAVIGDILFFGLVQLCLVLWSSGFNYHILIYQFSIAAALVFAIWMFNRNQKMAKKLAEEYHHKAAIAEAMTGYRQLYELNHEDSEYMELFNSLKDQLNINPSKSIDSFLNLKSPQEEISETIQSTLSPEKLKELAGVLKPFLN